MNDSKYLDTRPLDDLIKYRSAHPMDAVAFVGALRQHPYDSARCILFSPQQGGSPHKAHSDADNAAAGLFFEFKIADIVGADELPSEVDASGLTIARARLWLRRGALALRYEPFEVQ